MAMVVQHNMQAMNANRMLGITTGQQAKSTEKLSSGFRINRAADDAAGLTISEKMRKQIRGLDRASTNAQDGVSSVQTAEGALTEVHSMLQRMNELATQAANGTNSLGDREAIQAEIDQLTTEIDRVAETTKFNEIYLLKGDKSTKTINMEAHDAGLKGELVDNGNGKATFTMNELKVGDSVSIGGKNYNIISDGKQTDAVNGTDYQYTPATNASVTVDLTGWDTLTDSIQIGKMAASVTAADGEALVTALNADGDFAEDYTASLNKDGNLVITAKDPKVTGADIKADNLAATVADTAATITSADAQEATFANPNGTKLYAEDSKKALTDEEALAALKDGKTLYKTPGAGFKQTQAKINYTEAKNATATINLDGWTAANTSAIVIAGVTVTGAAAIATSQDVADTLNADNGFQAKYTASVSEDGKELIITANDPEASAADLQKIVTSVKVNNVTQTVSDDVAFADPVEASYKTTAKALYAFGGTEALTDEEILSALEKKEKLYSNAAGKGDNDITAEEAYELAKAELLKANSIGDMNETAAVEFANGGATADDYKVGDQVTIGGKKYTIGHTAESGATALTDAIDAEAKKAATPADTANGTALTLVGAVSDGTDSINVFKGGDGKLWYSTAATLSYNGANTTVADKTADDVEALFAAGKTITFTPNGGAAADAVTVMVADDENPDSTTISAEKAAELANRPSNSFEITTGSADVAKSLSFNLHVGADADMTNKIQVDIETMNSTYLGVKGLSVADETGIQATYAIDAIQDAISKVSSQRSALGAVQNRLEHTIANVDNIVENTTAAESRIRDTDMAKQMVEYSKNNILAQAGQSMLAQANQANQGVLGLLG